MGATDLPCGCREYSGKPTRMCSYHDGATDERARIVQALLAADGPGKMAWCRTAARWIERGDFGKEGGK